MIRPVETDIANTASLWIVKLFFRAGNVVHQLFSE